jgi:hypothetical protein
MNKYLVKAAFIIASSLFGLGVSFCDANREGTIVFLMALCIFCFCAAFTYTGG